MHTTDDTTTDDTIIMDDTATTTTPDPRHTAHILPGFPAVPRLTADREQSLAARRAAGDRSARDELVLANIPLAIKFAGKFRGGRHARDLPDLVSLAVLGLIDAADRYEAGKVSKGRVVRFGTYACHWIRCRLEPATIEDLATIRVPRRAWRSAEGADGVGAGKPTGNEAALAEHARRAIRLSAVGRAGDPSDPLDQVPARPESDPDGESSGPGPGLAAALAWLAAERPREARVVELVHPMAGGVSLTFGEAGAAMGRSREWARETYERGLRCLHAHLTAAPDEAPAPVGTRAEAAARARLLARERSRIREKAARRDRHRAGRAKAGAAVSGDVGTDARGVA